MKTSAAHHLFTSYEQQLFSKVVALAEKAGKTVHLLVVPSSNVFQGSAHGAAQLESAEIIAGRSATLTPEEQARRLGLAWEKLSTKPQRPVRFVVIAPEGEMHEFQLGGHLPKLTPEDIDLIHEMWLDATHEKDLEDLHHDEIVTIALERLKQDLKGPERQKVLEQLRTHLRQLKRAEHEKRKEST